jgi:signal peptidase I
MKSYRVIKHIRYMRNEIIMLKYKIINDAMNMTLNETDIFLLKKYSKRLHLLRM